ncbi:MAG: hypothetical protein KDE51_20190, partial [Anaerolineales bacterium]|nr:hypothetical protein [Anaerolineales bacterium]
LLITLTTALLTGRNDRTLQQRLSLVLWGLCGALLTYNYFALALPMSETLLPWGAWAGLATTLIGGGVGIILQLILQHFQQPTVSP